MDSQWWNCFVHAPKQACCPVHSIFWCESVCVETHLPLRKVYRNSVVDENDSGSQAKGCQISFWKILTKELIPCYSHTLDLRFFILFHKDYSSFVNLLIRLICQTPLDECNMALSSVLLLLGCAANTKNIQNLLLLHSSWGLEAGHVHATDIFWVEKCAAMHSSKDVYPAIIVSTFQCSA